MEITRGRLVRVRSEATDIFIRANESGWKCMQNDLAEGKDEVQKVIGFTRPGLISRTRLVRCESMTPA